MFNFWTLFVSFRTNFEHEQFRTRTAQFIFGNAVSSFDSSLKRSAEKIFATVASHHEIFHCFHLVTRRGVRSANSGNTFVLAPQKMLKKGSGTVFKSLQFWTFSRHWKLDTEAVACSPLVQTKNDIKDSWRVINRFSTNSSFHGDVFLWLTFQPVGKKRKPRWIPQHNTNHIPEDIDSIPR